MAHFANLLSLLIFISFFILGEKGYTQDEEKELCAIKQAWQAKISIEDIHGATTLYDTFCKKKKQISSWNQEEIQLSADTFKLQADLSSLYQLYEKMKSEKRDTTIYHIVEERIAWTILTLGIRNTHPKIRHETIVKASRIADIRILPFLESALIDENRYIRRLALSISSLFPDIYIQKKIEEKAAFGPKDERLQAIEILYKQDSPVISRSLDIALQEKEWNSQEKAYLLFLKIKIDENRKNNDLWCEYLSKLAKSDLSSDKMALIQYAGEIRSPTIFPLLIEHIIMKEQTPTPLLLNTLSLLGQHNDLIEKSEILYAHLEKLSFSQIDEVSLRALWLLALLPKSSEKAQEKLVTLLLQEKDLLRKRAIISHIRGLGIMGISLGKQIFHLIQKNEIELSIDSQATLSLYLLEQLPNGLDREEVAFFTLKILNQSYDRYYTFDISHGITFETIEENHDSFSPSSFHPFFAKEREQSDLLVRERLIKASLRSVSKPLDFNNFLLFFKNNLRLILESSLIEFLTTRFDLSSSIIRQQLAEECKNPYQKIGFASLLFHIGFREESLELLQTVLQEKNISKTILEGALFLLSQFPVEKVGKMITPYLMHNSLSIQIDAATSFLSSISQ